ncbi:ATP phosphoribosyltransferase [Candidatus Micrarchaeota archaeon]|nr:ATP phosphoribosyltransferase [Candidatus Micrarchaeota archaeon]
MIKIAIPNKGRISNGVKKLLEGIGISVPENGRKLYVSTDNPDIQIMYARAADIPRYVESGAADAGVTGEDMVWESEAEVEKLLKLNFGSCRISLAVPVDSPIKSPADYKDGMRVATKLSNITRKHLSKMGVECEIVPLAGATELAPQLGVADMVADQVSTGNTLGENNLRVVEDIAESSQYLIANKKSMEEKEEEIDTLRVSMESVINAEVKRYIMANVSSEEELGRVVEVMPAMDSPTVLKLAKEGAYSVHSVVDKSTLIQTIRKLKRAGAKDILVMNMSRVVD